MVHYIKTIFIDRREGQIVLFGSLAYVLVWAIASKAPNLVHVPAFFALMSPYVAFALALTYFQMGGFKRNNFESGWYNSGILVVLLLTPFLVTAWQTISK
jgi:hypothetical protein